ncbi:class I SAM-dependent methyltransferase [Commensalibacter oyaizuii]|uniref:SAM-dependent methyltransferase n=1 Tax=Commensalibacter oyaizuii TaxID=3043873 RepID=A0ABT6Q1A7_9PROT|nr:SAM-dependent methyltransferase [Commensalibacter sp. TBRC 16381]MDI2090864.1 SAM-dependent methyltransferase [Commensalibacter sp. TBRC 16381]
MTDSSPVRLDHFMAAANAAYYANKDPFSDFITAPEISQLFGEMIATWVVVVMQSMPAEGNIALVEAGPGRGTLMADVLRVIRKAAPELYKRCHVRFVETSPRLKRIQQQAVANHNDLSVEWYDSIATLPKGPMILIANEFLDALPIRQFVRNSSQTWAERYVKGDVFIQVPINHLPKVPIFNRSISVGDIVEVCESGQQIIDDIAKRICCDGGAALFIDYGYAVSVVGDTLQAIAHQKKVSPLAPIGSADLTAHIDFLALKEIAQEAGASVYGIQTQGEFLKQLGILLRAQNLMAIATVDEKQQLADAVYRLIDPAQMGHLFKVMAICHPKLPIPPAFEMDKDVSNHDC